MKINEITLYLEILIDYYGFDYIEELNDAELIELFNIEFDLIMEVDIVRGVIKDFINILDNVKTLTNCGISY